MALVIGLIVTLAMIGGMVAQPPFFTLLTDALGWRMTLLIDVMLLLIVLLMKDFPRGLGQSFSRVSNAFARPRFLARSIVANCKKQLKLVRWSVYFVNEFADFLLGAMCGSL